MFRITLPADRTVIDMAAVANAFGIASKICRMVYISAQSAGGSKWVKAVRITSLSGFWPLKNSEFEST